jgi:hypothetical protein
MVFGAKDYTQCERRNLVTFAKQSLVSQHYQTKLNNERQ